MTRGLAPLMTSRLVTSHLLGACLMRSCLLSPCHREVGQEGCLHDDMNAGSPGMPSLHGFEDISLLTGVSCGVSACIYIYI